MPFEITHDHIFGLALTEFIAWMAIVSGLGGLFWNISKKAVSAELNQQEINKRLDEQDKMIETALSRLDSLHLAILEITHGPPRYIKRSKRENSEAKEGYGYGVD